MEFGIFLNGYLPGPAAHRRDCEHAMLMTEIELAVAADAHNWKYAWFGERVVLAEPRVLPTVLIGRDREIDLCHQHRMLTVASMRGRTRDVAVEEDSELHVSLRGTSTNGCH